MKNKLLFGLFVFIFALCGTLGFVNVQALSSVYASSPSADVWNGKYATTVTNDDFYIDDVLHTIYIRSADGFSYFADNINNRKFTYSGYNVYLETDINLNSKNWTPIGNGASSFSGNFDGQGHYIYNLKIKSDNLSSDFFANVGLFASLSGDSANISNLHLRNVDIDASGALYVGGLVGTMPGGPSSGIENCSVKGNITAKYCEYVGGVVGGGSIKYLRNILSEVDITVTGGTTNNMNLGGVVGILQNSSFTTEISLLANYGDTSSTNSYGAIGGLIGCNENNTEIVNSYNSGNLTGKKNDHYLGGLVGLNSSNLTLASCYNRGEVKNIRTSSDNVDMFYVGGLVANSNGSLSVSNCFNIGEVYGRYTSGNTTITNANVDSLFSGSATETNVWYDAGENNKMPNDSKAIYDLVKFAKTSGFYSNAKYWTSDAWNFSNIWKIQSGVNESYPYLVANSFTNSDNSLSVLGQLKGEGTVESPYLIETVADLQYINTILANTTSAYYYALQNDLDLSGNKTWIPLGYSTAFTGVFDGNGHTISGLNCSLNAQFGVVGLFGFTQNAVIKNLTISNFNYVGSNSTTQNIGNMIGRVDSTTYLINCKDNSNTENPTVGRVLNNSYLQAFYGQNNLNINGEVDVNTLKGVGLSGYDLTIYGNGGTFYNSDSSIYTGDYHVLVYPNKSVFDISNIDLSYGKGGSESAFLPVKSNNVTTGYDYVMYPGYALNGYKYFDNNQNSLVNFDGTTQISKAISGLYANFTLQKNTVSVVYNSYEKANFDAASDFVLSYSVDNDTYLYNNKEVFETINAKISEHLQLLDLEFYLDEDFTKLVYSIKETSEGVFERNLDTYGNNDFIINENITIYAKWVAKTCDTENSTKTVTIRFNKTDRAIYNQFKLIDAISSIALYNNDSQSAVVAFTENQIKEYTEINGVLPITFNIDTKRSDVKENFKQILIVLKTGYNISIDTTITYTSPDADFGVLKSDIKNNTNINLYNVLNDIVIDVTLQVSEIANTLNVDSSLYLALSPEQTVSTDGVYIYASGNYQRAENLFGIEEGAYDGLYFGYDFVKKAFLSSKTGENWADKMDAPTSVFTKTDGNYYIYVRYGIGSSAKFYCYEYAYTDTTWTCTLYECESDRTKVGMLARFNKLSGEPVYGSNLPVCEYAANETTISRLSSSVFVMLSSTEDDTKVISDFTNFEDDRSGTRETTRLVVAGSGVSPNKLMTIFREDKEYAAGLNFKTQYTEAYVSFSFATYNKTINNFQKLEELTPTISFVDGGPNYSVLQNGTIKFVLTPSSDYTLANSSSNLLLYRKTDIDLSRISLQLKVTNTGNNVWEEEFNNNNSNYISATYSADGTVQLAYTAGMLLSGHYEVVVICENVDYTISYDVVYTNSTKNISVDSLDNDEVNSGILVSINGTSTVDNVQPQYYNGIKYQDKVSVKTEFGGNSYGYTFVGWQLGERVFTNLSNDFIFDFASYYEQYGDNLELTVKAIYLRRTVNVALANVIRIEGSSSASDITCFDVGLTLNGQNDYSFEYTFSTSRKELNLNFVKQNGGVANAYYFSGFDLVYLSGGRYVSAGTGLVNETATSASISENFDIFDVLNSHMQTNGNVTNYYIMPVLAQKEIQIYVHSGTGDSENIYGDQKYGSVSGSYGNMVGYDVNNQFFTNYFLIDDNRVYYSANKTEIELNFAAGYTGYMFLNGQKSNVQSVVNPALLYTQRVGYFVPNFTGFWAATSENLDRKFTLSGNSLVLPNFFTNSPNENLVKIHVYRAWEAYYYYINFNITEEGGTIASGNTLSSVLATYDLSVDNTNILNKEQVLKTGYEFDGWYYRKADGTSVKIFDADANLVDAEVLFNGNGEYKVTNNVDLYAHFETLEYSIRIFVNGATEIEGVDISNENNYLDYYYLFEDVVYDSRFVNSSGIKLFNLLENLRITRTGFDFAGLYATNGGQVQMISENTIFDASILSVDLNKAFALDLYIMWQYDETSLQFGFIDDNFASRNYNSAANNQVVYIAEILKDNLNLVGFDVEVDASGTQFTLKPVGTESVSLTLSLTSTDAETSVEQLGENFMAYFVVNDAKNYAVTLNIRVNDNSNYLSLGSLFNQDYTLYLTVNKIGVDFNLTSTQTEQIRLTNVKTLVEPFVSSDVMVNVNASDNFEKIMKALGEDYLIRAAGLDTREKVQDILYRYLMYKYYNLTITNDGQTYLQFKADYEYDDFENSYFNLNNKQTIDNIVNSLNFFENNDYALHRNIMEVNKYDGNLALNTSELAIDKIMFYSSNSNGLVPQTSAIMRIYVSEIVSGSLENYNYNSDENGNYINYNSYVYIMPEILKITNSGAKSSYFEQNIARKSINWATNSSISYNNDTYYLVETDNARLYVRASIYTSNAGDSESDTEFSFVGKDNFLYFSSASILLEDNGNYVDVSNYYKLTLDENNTYTILSVAGVAKVTLNATYLTLENREPVRGNLSDLENYNLLSLLSVSSVSYTYKYDETNVVSGTISGSDLVVGDNTIQVPSSENPSLLIPITICVVEQNNNNTISVYLTRWVTKAEFSLSQTSVDNFALYEWCLDENRTYSVGRTMESRNGITVVPTFDGQKNNVEVSSSTKVFEIDVDSESGLNTTNICAVFTDLVYVAYDYNLPQQLISNLSLASGTNLKIDSSTLADLRNSYPDNITGVGGLVLGDITISWDGENFYVPSEVFAGSDDDSIFQGRSGNTHTPLTVKSVWTISELTATQNITNLQVAVQSLGSLLASDVVSVSANENLYDFIYKWKREVDGAWIEIEVEEPDILAFENGGTSKDSGNYRLTISVKTKDILNGYVDDKVLSETYNFEILFKKHLVNQIVLPSDLTDEYTSSDILLTNGAKTGVTISYKQWQNESGEYSDNIQTSIQNYLTKGSLEFTIKYFANESSVGEDVTELLSAGRYVFTVTPNTEIFELSDTLANTFEFEYIVTPSHIEISELGSLAWSKTFYNNDPAMEIVYTYGNDTLTLKFEREAGERTTYTNSSGNKVNLYNVWLASVENVDLNNYAFYYHGTLLDLSAETTVGSFTINASGTLLVSYQVTEELPKTLTATYSGGVYTLEFNAEGNFVVKLDGVAVYTIEPVLYDNTRGNVTGEYLEILKSELQNVSAYFALGRNVYTEGVSNVATYTYNFAVGDFNRYYTAVEFDGSYSFAINQKTIDVSELNTITKVFDNNNTTYVDLEGNAIADLDAYTGAYLIATYSTVHAGEEISLTLALDYIGEDADVYLANYALSTRTTTGVIEKVDATLTINLVSTLDASSFVYGKVLNNTLSQLVNSENPVTLTVGGVNHTDWLDMLYCTLIYNVDDTNINSNGFIYAGTHTLTATNSIFNDFNITNINGTQFTITPYEYEYEIPANLFIENTTNVVKEIYSTSVSITGLGESVDLQFEIDDDNFEKNEDGTTKQAGTYHLSLVGDGYYSNNSIHVTISNIETNKGITIVAETNVLYLVVEDVSDLSQYYNNQDYQLQLLFEGGRYVLEISSDATGFVTRKLATHLQNSAGQTVDVDDISDVTLALNMSVKEANKYKLSLTFTGSNILYTNFISEQFFTVEKIKINVESASFKQALKKQYDGTYTKTITTFDEKLTDNDVSILANYNNDPNAGQKDVTLSLQGNDSRNYELVFKDETQKVTGEILKADATIVFVHNYEYGDLSTSKNANSFGVEFSVVLSSDMTTTITQYTVSSFNVVSPVLSGTYLCVDTYNVQIAISAINYNINFESSDLNGSKNPDIKIVVDKRQVDLTLNRNGGASAQYMSNETLTAQFEYSDISDLREQFTVTLERDVNESGSLIDVGYYRVKTGNYTDNSGNYIFHVVDESDYGFYQITISTETQYLLLAENGNQVNEDNVITRISTEYLGVQFDTINVNYSEELGLYLEISNGIDENAAKITKQLAFYTYDTTNKVYNKNNINVANLDVELAFYSSFVKNVGTYGIYALSSTSGNYEIHAGKSGETICFTLVVTERILTFKDTTLQKSFDNKPASMTYQGYEQLSSVVNGALIGEDLGLLIEFYDGAALALHTKSGLTVKATLTRQNGSSIVLSNYKLTGLDSDGVVSGVTGNITRAGLTVVIDTQNIVYGQIMQTGGTNTNINSLQLNYVCQLDFAYNQTLKLTFDIILPNSVDDFSSARLLKAGNYNMTMSGNFDDFEISTVVLNGTTVAYNSTLYIPLRVERKTLTARALTSQTLSEILTKAYDGNTSINISGLVGLNGIETDDIVLLAGAEFESSHIGSTVFVNFSLVETGDFANYTVEQAVGTITPIIINITYNDNTPSGITATSPAQRVSQIRFPLSGTNLTTNSNNSATAGIANFPSTLGGWEGHYLLGWAMNFENIETTSDEYNFLKNYGTYDATTKIMTVSVDNDVRTVNFLNALLNGTENLFGNAYYYKGKSNIGVTFDAVWDVLKYNVSIKVTDRDGSTNAGLGSFDVVVTDEDGQTTTTTALTNKTIAVAYGASITITAHANNHCIFNNIYNRTDNVSSNFADTYSLSDVKKNYDIWVSFTVDEVTVVLDLSEYSDDITISGGRGLNFTKNENVFTATVDYLSFEKLNFSNLPNIATALYNLSGWSDGNIVVSRDNFATTTLLSLLPSGNTLTLYAKFVVTVTLNYNDGVTSSKTVNINYGDTYLDNTMISTEPTREGYDFAGWYVGEELINGTTEVSDAKSHTITARWTIKKYNIELTVQNATIESEKLTKNGDIYTANMEYSSNLTFTVYANSGYEISESGWSREFNIISYTKSQVTVVLVVPAKDVKFTIPVEPLSNHVALSWNGYIDNVVVTNMTDDEQLVLDTNNMFRVVTGKVVKIVITPEIGYTLTEDITFSKEVEYTANINKGVLTLTISNIDEDINISFVAEEGINTVTFSLGEDLEAYKTISILGRNYTADDFANGKIEVSALTNSTLNVSVVFNHGFMMNSCVSVRYDIENINQTLENGNYVLTFNVSSIVGDSDVVVTTKRLTYNINLQVIAFDSNGNAITTSLNDAEIDGYGKSATNVEFGNTVTLKLINRESGYSFVGFSDSVVNGDYTILSNAESYLYTVKDSLTVYAVFSTRTYYLSFDIAEYYRIEHTKNGEPSFDVYNKFDAEDLPNDVITNLNGTAISTAEIKLGMSVTVIFKAPEGFRYYGVGIMGNDDSFTYIEATERNVNGKVEITISSQGIGGLVSAGSDIVDIMFLVSSYEVSIDVGSYIYIDGDIEDDNYTPSAGQIFLQDEEGNLTNRFGYVAGTRIHYFMPESNNNAHFSVIAYTGSEVYLKVAVGRRGYTFYDLISDNQNVSVEFVSEQYDNYIYKISGLVGGLGQNVSIMALFKPQINTINLSFNNDIHKVNGGAIVVETDSFNSNKVYNTGNNYSSTIVSAYTDSRFTVSAYVRLGYHVDIKNLVSNSPDVVLNNVRFTSLSVENTGYTGVVTFDVSDFFGNNDVQIQVLPTTYTINLLGENKTLAKIKNVEYDSILDLSSTNENIEIIDNSVGFEEGKLQLVMQKTNYNFEGYFTYSGGSGVQYINSEGNVIKNWQETGYIFNGLTSRYELSNNATVTNEDIEINLYLYFSYFKTRFNFEFVPDISTSYTAENIISGVDYSNSWFYGSSPLYMEVAFDTEITITAPNLNGYKFYKFEIIEKNKDGNLQESDGYKYSRSINWSTNESEAVVECTVKIYYFAQVQVEVLGGEGSFEITQTADDAQAEQLIREGYVNTERQFSIRSKVGEGYNFIRWTNANTGKTYTSNNGVLTLSTTEKIMLIMAVQGKPVTLNFNYTADNGVLVDLSTTSGVSVRLGQLVGDNYRVITNTAVVRVGDEVMFRVLVNKDFAVTWSSNFGNLPTPTLTSDYDETRQYIFYSLIITPEFVGNPVTLSVSFEASMITVFINSDFVDKDKTSNTIDGNNVLLAGRTKFNGTYTDYFRVQYNQNIKIEIEVFEKYKLASVTLRNYGRVYQFEDISNNEIMLSMEYLLDNNIIGLLQVELKYTRLLWENETFEMTEFNGRGTEENPYEIWTAEDLTKMMLFINGGDTNVEGYRYTNGYFKLMADINLSGEFWTPIGTWENSFNGTFDFNGYNILGISNAYFYDITSHNGLFGVLGGSANIIENKTSIWYIFLIIGVVVFLILMVVIILIINYRIKKRRKAIEGK